MGKKDTSRKSIRPLEQVGSLLLVTGVDGAGKTTISKWIVSEFQKKHFDVDIVWSRFNNYLSIPLLALTKITGHNYYKVHGGVKFGFHDFERLYILRRIFFFLQMIDVNIATYFKIFRKIADHKIIICERGPWDTLVDVISDTGLHENLRGFFSKLYALQISDKQNILYIKRSYENIISMRPELIYDKKLTMRISLYDRLAKENGWFIVDNDGDLDSTKKEIAKILKL